MALEHRLEVKLMQKLVLTPQLQQAIKLLQMPQLELSMTLNNELVENPFLEDTVEQEGDAPDEAPLEMESPESESFTASEEAEAPLEQLMGFGAEEYFDSRSYDGRDLGYFSPDVGQGHNLEQYVSEDSTLYDHITWQLRLSSAKGKLKEAAELVIGNIDERGYLGVSEDELAQLAECDMETARGAIALVQSFDPPGVAARDLIECLVIQLRQLGLEGSLVEAMVRQNLPDIERKRYQQIATQHGCSLDEIKQAVKVIEGLDPKPGSAFSSTQTIYIKPDVYVVRDTEEFRILLNDENMPNLRINGYYRRLLSQRNTLEKEEREYLSERLRSAVWLLKSLDHRNKTLYRVTESIIRFQYDFFDKNVSYMKPLNLKDVAEDLGMHESTISRATSNKYLSCPHGIFNFRFFFSSGLQGQDGVVSSNYVRDMIKKIIEEENVKKPLSDQKISDLLAKSSITVARRTVAKYREEMNIPPQSLRKRLD